MILATCVCCATAVIHAYESLHRHACGPRELAPLLDLRTAVAGTPIGRIPDAFDPEGIEALLDPGRLYLPRTEFCNKRLC